ncbi:hypothetical protein [Tessaracoccus flavescens]|uniref:hypothetical protein n=1 Tax=Tessaracoccus flavescens TaxID=399497 RepID=UPI00126021F0|nr:hypothetical protein [Tessaracoccus flavescens]
MPGIRVHLVAEPSPARVLVRALRSPLIVRHLTPAQALRSPGAGIGADVTVLAFEPGTQPVLEAEAFAGAGLYARWDSRRGEIGPVLGAGSGPCPRCLAGSTTQATGGDAPLLGAWVGAWTALQCLSMGASMHSELIGVSWRWHLSHPGLELALWPRQGDCPVSGCTTPRTEPITGGGLRLDAPR